MKTIDLVIFDCDGVLVDSEGPLGEVVADDLRSRGFDITPQDFHDRFVGGIMPDIRKRLVAAGADLPESWVDHMYNAIFDRMAAGVPVTDGVHDMLDWLEAAGKKVAVASNGPMGKMERSLGPSGLFERLSGRIYSAHDHGTSKPEPGLLLKAASDAGVSPDRAVMVDDSPVGAWAARDAGMRFFGYVEHGNAAKMKNEGAALVHSMADLKRELGQL